MAHRKRRPGGKRTSRPLPADPSRSPAEEARERPHRRPLPPPHPPRKNLPLLLSSIVLLAAWVVFLAVLAVTGG